MGPIDSLSTTTVPPQMVQAAVQRLRWITVICAVLNLGLAFEIVVISPYARPPPQSAVERDRLLAALPEASSWTQETAIDWWDTHLPPSCSYRSLRQHEHADASELQTI